MFLIKLAVLILIVLVVNKNAIAEADTNESSLTMESSPGWRPHGSLGAGIKPLLSFQTGITNGTHSFDYGAGIAEAKQVLIFMLSFNSTSLQNGSQYLRYRYTTNSGLYAGIGIADYWDQKTFNSIDIDSDDQNKTCIGCAENVGNASFHQLGPELSLGFTSNAFKKGFFFNIDIVSYMKPLASYGRTAVHYDVADVERQKVSQVAAEWVEEQDRKDKIVVRAMVFAWGGRF